MEWQTNMDLFEEYFIFTLNIYDITNRYRAEWWKKMICVKLCHVNESILWRNFNKAPPTTADFLFFRVKSIVTVMVINILFEGCFNLINRQFVWSTNFEHYAGFCIGREGYGKIRRPLFFLGMLGARYLVELAFFCILIPCNTIGGVSETLNALESNGRSAGADCCKPNIMRCAVFCSVCRMN